MNLVDQVHGLFFTGGSAFGHNVAGGVRQYLRERNLGFDTGHGLVPIVAGAVIFDLSINRSAVYPDAALGYAAWVVVAPFMYLPMGDGVELSYSPWQQVVVNLGVICGVSLLAGSAATALGPWGRRRVA